MTEWTSIYQTDNYIQAHCVKGLLEHSGIEVTIKGDALQGAIGELPAVGTNIELSVQSFEQHKAKSLVDNYENSAQAQWQCRQCKEMNESTFEICWHCGHDPLSETE